METSYLKSNLREKMFFNTSNIKIVVDMSIADSGATVHFVLPDTHVKYIKPADKPLCINFPDGKQIKYTHTCQIDIPWLLESATRAHIVPELVHTSLISVKMLCDYGCKVEYDTSKCRVIFKHIIVWKVTREPTTSLWVLSLDPKYAYTKAKLQVKSAYPTLIKTQISNNAYTITSKRYLI